VELPVVIAIQGTIPFDAHLTLRMTMRIPFKTFCAVAAALACLTPRLSVVGAVATVTVQNYVFVPATTNINAGDSVVWQWLGGTHNVTSTSNPPSWTATATVDSTTFTFTNTFNIAGTFPYECTVDARLGMVGSIIVAAAPPTVTITNPLSGALLAAPATVTIGVTATDAGGTVTNVQFLIGSTVFSNRTAAPFVAVAGNLSAGSYTLSAIAADNRGLKATNTVSIHLFTPISLGSGLKSSSTDFQFSYSANAGFRYVVQTSTNLTNWVALSTNSATTNSAVFSDSDATNNPAFYRVGLLPSF
jgi:plastocyanin